MPDYAHAINQHYGQAELSAKILTALQEAGQGIAALTRDDLASFDCEHNQMGRAGRAQPRAELALPISRKHSVVPRKC